MDAILRRLRLGNASTINISNHLKEKFDKEIEIVRNDKINLDKYYDTVIRWGCTSTIKADHVINLAKHMHQFYNKILFRDILQSNNISVPKTFFNKRNVNIFPVIGRESNHHQGRNIILCTSEDDLYNDIRSEYWSEYIKKDREFRIYTFFGKIIKVDEKVPTEKGKNEIAWNQHLGNSSFRNVRWNSWPLESISECLKVLEIIPIHFSGIDVICKDNIPYILEGNTAPTQDGNYGSLCFAKGFNWALDIINETGKLPKMFEFPENISSYRDVIHPAIFQRRQ